MINTDKYNITNSRIINMILPFYARGRKLSLLLEAISHPIGSIHDAYKNWTLERLIEASITSQSMSIVWYLNHCFRKYFLNKEDSFQILTESLSNNSTIWTVDEQPYHDGSTPWMMNSPSEKLDGGNKLVTRNYNERDFGQLDIVIYAPKILETSLFTTEMYINEIKKRFDKYLTIQDSAYTVVIN